MKTVITRSILAFAAATVVGACASTPAVDTDMRMSGGVLVDRAGRTLYTFDKDQAGSGTSQCTGPWADIVACIPSLRRYARGLLADRDRADDLVQDTLEKAWRRMSMWQKKGDLRAWMFGIMHNQFVDRLRAQRARPEDAAGDNLPEVAQRPMQADLLEIRDLNRLLQQLPPEQREVLLLVSVEEFSYQERPVRLLVKPRRKPTGAD